MNSLTIAYAALTTYCKREDLALPTRVRQEPLDEGSRSLWLIQKIACRKELLKGPVGETICFITLIFQEPCAPLKI